MKTLTLLYFAHLRDLVGTSEERVETNATTIAELRNELETHHAALAGRWASIRFAKNEAFAADEDALADGDVVALLPPVAGG
ncbi:MAG TPA: molybdopterin converting factor subunit 1 [Polyangiaceae bacterium]